MPNPWVDVVLLHNIFLANTVQHSTTKVYPSAFHSLHIEQGFADFLVDCSYNEYWEESRELMVIPPCYAFQLLMASLYFWAACTLAYFGFPHSAKFTIPNLASFSILDSLMFQWIPRHLHHAYGFATRPQKQIHFARAIFFTSAGVSTHFVPFTLYWHIWPWGAMLQAPNFCIKADSLYWCLDNLVVAWHLVFGVYPRQFFQPQLPVDSTCQIHWDLSLLHWPYQIHIWIGFIGPGLLT